MIEWHDSTFESQWRYLQNLSTDLDAHYSMGFLLSEDDKQVTIAQSVKPETEHDKEMVADTLTIPRPVIQSITQLRKK